MEIVTEYRSIPEKVRDKLNNANIYYSEEFYNSMNGKNVFYFFDNNRVLVSVLHKRLFFRFFSLPSEPFVWNVDFNIDERTFMDKFVQCCKKMKRIDWIGPSEVTALFTKAPSQAVAIPFGSHVIDLELTPDEIWLKIHSKHRNVIRKAQKEGVTIKIGKEDLLDDYLMIDKETWERNELDVDFKTVYKRLLSNYPNNCYVFMAYHENTPQGGAIFLANPSMSYYLYGASKNNPVTGSMNFLHWEAITFFKQKGVKRYSFVGCRINEDKNSKFHGIQRFKERFGGTLSVGKMFKVILHDNKYRLYLFIKKKKNKCEYKDIVDQELHKWKD